MKTEDFSIKSFQDGLTIQATMISADEPIGVLQLVHGMSEHRQRYFSFMKEMAQNGWCCVIHDHRGHGDSVKSQDDLGYFYDSSGTYIVEDTHQLTYVMKKQYPDLPYVLFGHSMGSLVVRAYIKKYDYELNGLIVCGSPSKNSLLPLGQALILIIQKLKGEHYRSKFVQRLAFSAFSKRFRDSASENAWICSDDRVVKAYDSDERCGFIFTVNGFRSLWNLMANVYDKDDWVLLNPNLPILFIAGRDDPCIVNERKFIQAFSILKKIGYQNIKPKLYPKLRHEILNEKGKEQVYEDIAVFLRSTQEGADTKKPQ